MPKVIKLQKAARSAGMIAQNRKHHKRHNSPTNIPDHIPIPIPIPSLIRVDLTPERSTLPIYSYHIIEAIFTCHMWGVVRYGLRRTYDAGGQRALALEAGSAMHEIFAAIRLWQLANVQKLREHVHYHGPKLFGLERYSMLDFFMLKNFEPREHLISLCFSVLHSSGYYDDPRDNIRTLTNMESALISYIDEYLPLMKSWEIYVHDPKNPTSPIGVELTTDAVLHYSDGKIIRYIGTADAVLRSLLDRAKPLYVGENKTASRLDDSWRLSFELSHQVTGYNVITTAKLAIPVYRTKVFGLRLQSGQQNTYESFEPQIRTREMIHVWANWVYSGVTLYEHYGEDFESTQRLTHSCNRYFRPCALLTFCADTPEGREMQIKDMVESDLSPSEQAVALGSGV